MPAELDRSGPAPELDTPSDLQLVGVDLAALGSLLLDSRLRVSMVEPATGTGEQPSMVTVFGPDGRRTDESGRVSTDGVRTAPGPPLYQPAISGPPGNPSVVTVPATLSGPAEAVVRTGEPMAVVFDTATAAGPHRNVGWVFRSGRRICAVWRDRGPVPATGRPLDGEGAGNGTASPGIGTWDWDLVTDRVTLSAQGWELLTAPAGPAGSVEPAGGRPAAPPQQEVLTLPGLLDALATTDRRRVASTLQAAVTIDAPFSAIVHPLAAPGRALRIVGRPIASPDGRGVTGVVEDVTAALQRQEAARSSERLASLGMLAAGVAHDINNVLTVVAMRADMIRSDALEGEAADPAEDAQAILDATERAMAITRQLMVFAGRQEGEVGQVDLTELVRGMRPLVEGLRGRGPTVVELDTAAVPPVLADATQLEQVVLNLAVNARDAVAEGVPEPRVVLAVRALRAPGQPTQVVLEVRDNGHGMDRRTLARAGDPFFTTKVAGRGTGLGLSVVAGIVDRLGGRLDFDTAPGRGTTARVSIPAVPEPARSAAGPAPTVLVVDDEPELRAVHTRVLERAGYRVLLADDAAGALAALAADPGVTAVVSDVNMPGMDGTELAGRILRDHPAIGVLLVSGSGPTDQLVHPRLGMATKPLTGAQLVAGVQRVVAGVPAGSG